MYFQMNSQVIQNEILGLRHPSNEINYIFPKQMFRFVRLIPDCVPLEMLHSINRQRDVQPLNKQVKTSKLTGRNVYTVRTMWFRTHCEQRMQVTSTTRTRTHIASNLFTLICLFLFARNVYLKTVEEKMIFS